jgi:hybrid cluster-associated redox disulfide protein
MVTDAPIAKTTPIGEVLRMYPGAMAVLRAHGMDCNDCMGATNETLESGARMCMADIDSLLHDLNDLTVAASQE